jgi:hypothetical protein
MEKSYGADTTLDDKVKLDLIEKNSRENTVDSKE